MTDLKLSAKKFTDRGGAAVHDVIGEVSGVPCPNIVTLGQVRIPPDPRIKELETKLKVKHDTSELRQTIRDLDRERKAERKRNGHLARRINELEAQVEQWKADYHRTASEKVKLEEKLLDMENK
jgi:hypothetical protein